ncbi:MAG: IS1634 family transposase [Christensenellaceae bacterium]|jgi:transposase|nr:IS1634 family transposase [Christensenellaceae bacterium]
MAYNSIHINKKTGAKYLYVSEGYWDKEKKQSRNKQICLGRIDDVTGEVIPSGRAKRDPNKIMNAVKSNITKASNRIIGPIRLLDKLANDLGLVQILLQIFGSEICNYLLSLVFYLVLKGKPLSLCDTFADSYEHPYNDTITNQKTSEVLSKITTDNFQSFFISWFNTLSEDEYFYHDITSISSYSKNNTFVECGYNQDNEKLPQINLAVIFGRRSGLPVCFRVLPGSVNDVSTLETTLKSLFFIDQYKMTFVMDRDFNSMKNICELFNHHHHFILATSSTRIWIKELILAKEEGLVATKNFYYIDQDGIYMQTYKQNLDKHRCYLHIYFNDVRRSIDFTNFLIELSEYKKKLENKLIKLTDIDNYKRYFVIEDTPKKGIKVDYNEEEIELVRSNLAGYFCILTSEKMTALEALTIYRNKDAVEKCFDDCKNELDLFRLRIQSDNPLSGKLFIHFIASIIYSQIRNIKNQNSNLKNLGVEEILTKLETISVTKYTGRYDSVTTKIGAKQREILEAFNVKI